MKTLEQIPIPLQIKRDYSVLLIWLLALSSCQIDHTHELGTFPNVVMLLADDLGYGDLGCYGGIANTPNLDTLARHGLFFTDFYAAAPNCSPSRAGLLTGRSPSRVGVYNYLSNGHPMHLRSEELTLAELVKKRGFHTGHFGKWHLSCLPQNPSLRQPQPADQGFDYSFGTANNAEPSHFNPVNFVRNGEMVGPLQGYSCDLITVEAIDWIEQIPSGDPFFLYLAFHEPHKKVASPADLMSKYEEYSEQDAAYFANVENLDRAVGKLISFLRRLDLLENTLLVFASDNGSYRSGSNGVLLGGKSFLYEGGIRVPAIFHWPRYIKSSRSVTEPAGLIDIVPTVVELLQLEQRGLIDFDGQSLVPLLHGTSWQRTNPLSWFFYRTTPEMAMRKGDYTILGRDLDSTLHTHAMTQPDMTLIRDMTLDSFEIYNVKKDPSQMNPIDMKTLANGEDYLELLRTELNEIQSRGFYWDNLPSGGGPKRYKHEWRQLRPTGFSN